MSTLSRSETELLVNLLAKCEPGDLPSEVFSSIARVAVYPAVEFVPLRTHHSHTEVLLISREQDDPVWPNMLHTPGTILRPTDEDFTDACSRLLRDELPGVRLSEPKFIGAFFTHHARGTGVGFEYWLEVYGQPAIGEFYDTSKLPENLIPEQRSMVARAVEAFEHSLQRAA